MSRGIKIMAKDLGVPVVALSQLSRQVESRTGKTPQLSDLRESGAIEQDADIVILLDRSMTDEEAARDDRPDKDVTNFIIAKNRSGPLGVVPLTFLPGSTKFVEVDTHHEE
jgi:replicative DNA helicase